MSQFGIKVVFKQIASNTWSKAYTYRSILPYKNGDVVVVPTGSFYSVGKVTECLENYDFNPSLTYKDILIKVPV